MSTATADEMVAAVKARDTARVRALLTADPALANARATSGETPMLLATYYDAGEIAELLRAHGARLDLHEAAASGDIERVRTLLAAEPASISSLSHDGWAALHLAAHFGHVAIVEVLLAAGADVHARSGNRLANTALHAAAAGGYIEVIAILLRHGADVNARQHGGFTALHAAAQDGEVAMVRLLLDHGADPALAADDGTTPLALAHAGNHDDVVALLKDADA